MLYFNKKYYVNNIAIANVSTDLINNLQFYENISFRLIYGQIYLNP